MKAAKQRAKARSAFRHRRRIMWRADATGQLFAEPTGPGVPVVVIRGRTFTRPQAAHKIHPYTISQPRMVGPSNA